MIEVPTQSAPLPADRGREVRRVLWLTLALNLLVCGIKAAIGFWSGSLAVLADAAHSMTDGANNLIALMVVRWAAEPPDREHPYGHDKFEAIGALLIAGFLAIACFEVLRSAFVRLAATDFAAVSVSGAQLLLLLVVLAVNIFVARYEAAAGKRLGSALLQADAQHTLGDIWVTLGVLAGVGGMYWLHWSWLDVAVALPVAGAVAWSAWAVLRSNLPWLLDSSAIPAEQIREVTLGVPGVLNCHRITSRGLPGRQVFVEMHLVTSAREVEAAHRITDEIEQRLQQRFGPVLATIHVEPPSHIEDA